MSNCNNCDNRNNCENHETRCEKRENCDNRCDNRDNCDCHHHHNEKCNAVGFQKVEVSVPVTVIPFAKVGPTKTKCVGEPMIMCGAGPCRGKKDCVCCFTISQKLVVEVPVAFGANTMIGDTFIDCLETAVDNKCSECKC